MSDKEKKLNTVQPEKDDTAELSCEHLENVTGGGDPFSGCSHVIDDGPTLDRPGGPDGGHKPPTNPNS